MTLWSCCKLLPHCIQPSVLVSSFHLLRGFPSFLPSHQVCRPFSFLSPAWTDTWGQAHSVAVGDLGVEEASRNEGHRAQEKGDKEEALSQASLFSSPTRPGHGPTSGHSPTTGALTPEVSPPQGATRSFNHDRNQACMKA